MTVTELLAPILEGGIRRTHFFNGRLLTAEDLRADQAADRAKRGQLGRLFGRGVAHGLMVTPVPGAAAGAPVVRVEPGLALDGLGQVIELPLPADIRLVQSSAAPPTDGGLFEVCVPPMATAALPSGVGAYILTISGVSGFQGRAPAAGLAANALPGGACGSRWAVEGVCFRLVPLPFSDIGLPAGNAADLARRSDPESRIMFRSVLASACLGLAPLEAALAAQPAAAGSAGGEVGAIATLAGSGALGECEVPLALLIWRGNGLEPPDPWAVRRGLDLSEADAAHGRATGATMRRLGLAAMLHFQHLIAQQPSMLQSSARNHLAALPPVGVLPTNTDWPVFLGHHGPAIATPVDPAMLGAALRAGLDLPGALLPPPAASGRVDNATPYEVLDGGNRFGFVFRRLTSPRLRVIIANPLPAGLVLEVQPVGGGTATRGSLAPEVRDVAWSVSGGRCFIIDGAAAGLHRAVAIAGNLPPSISAPQTLVAGRTLDVILAAPTAQASPTTQPGTQPEKNLPQPARCVTVQRLHAKLPAKLRLCMVPEALEEKNDLPASREIFLRGLDKTTKTSGSVSERDEKEMVDVSPDRKVTGWLNAWGDYLKWIYRGEKIKFISPAKLLVDAAWRPARNAASVREKPPAWAVFGDIAIPVSISVTKLQTRVPVRVNEARIPGLDDQLVEQLEKLGIRTLDDLAASWAERLRGPRPRPGWLDPVPDIIFEAVARTEKINLDRDYLAGATDEVKKTLDQLGLNDDVALANADPAALGKELGDTGLAGRLVLQARRIVPESAWSLGALALDAGLTETLVGLGLDSQGALVRAAAGGQPRDAIIKALTSDDSVPIDNLVGSAVANMTSASVTLAPAALLGSVKGVDANAADSSAEADLLSAKALDVGLLATIAPSQATALKSFGIETVYSLARADIGVVANLLGGDEVQAAAIMHGARAALDSM
ncbi:MAG: hypothetical protein INF84_08285 [Roseomonas sp.]|nr:hypothetical protein [Roseomonas sp.]